MLATKKILTVTVNPAIDKSTSIGAVVPEKKLRCAEPRFEPGGGGINVSRALKKLGCESVAIYPSGGHSGNLLNDLLDAEGIKRCSVPIEDDIRVNLIVYENSTGQQYRFGFPGQRMTDSECHALLEEIPHACSKPDFVVASGSLPRGVPIDFHARIIRMARELGAKTVLDTSGDALKEAVKEKVFLLKTNLNEFRELADSEVTNDEELLSAASRLVSDGNVEYLVVSLEAAGALGVWKGGAKHVIAPVVPVRSKIGAGDSMVAGIVLKFAMGKSFEDALAMGVAAGTAAVMTEGTELCTKEDSTRLYWKILRGEAVRDYSPDWD